MSARTTVIGHAHRRICLFFHQRDPCAHGAVSDRLPVLQPDAVVRAIAVEARVPQYEPVSPLAPIEHAAKPVLGEAKEGRSFRHEMDNTVMSVSDHKALSPTR